MSRFGELLAQEQGRSIDDLDGFDKAAALDAGINNTVVGDWALVHDAYYGATRHTAAQRRARETARAKGTTLSKLAAIERIIAHITNESARWRLRQTLLGVAGRCDTLRRAAKDIVPAKTPAPPKPGITLSAPRDGMRTLTWTAPDEDITHLEVALHHDLDPGKPQGPQKLARLHSIVFGDHGVPTPVPRPIVAVPVDASTTISRDDDGTVLVTSPDGTTTRLETYLHDKYGSVLEVAAFHPVEGALDLFRASRSANRKQRTLAAMVQPQCSHPDCRLPAEVCEMHHITAWRLGGYTNLDNLAPLCRYHNRINDDDPARPQRGRIEMLYGRPTWVSPRGYPVANTTPTGAMQLLFGDPPPLNRYPRRQMRPQPQPV